MNEWVRRSLSAGALTAGAVGAVVATGAAANADTTMITNDNVGILNGSQVYAPIQAPVNLCGAAAAIGGAAVAGCEGGSAASLEGLYDVKLISTENRGVLNGTQLILPVQIPVNVCGVTVAVLGDAAARCDGGASATATPKGGHHRKPKASVVQSDVPSEVLSEFLSEFLSEPVTSGPALPSEPVTSEPVTSESVRVESTGDDDKGKPCHGCPKPQPPKPQPEPPANHCPPSHHKPKHKHNEDVTLISKDNVGILNGTQVYAPIQAPVNMSSISAAILGHAWSISDGGSSARL